MKICNRCNIKIIDNSKICPLCKSKLFDIDKNIDSRESENTYPFILGHLHRYNIAIKILLLVSIILALSSILINFYTTKDTLWSLIAIAGIIYCWLTTLFSIRKDINIGAHLLIQTICISIILIIIDNVLGYIGWSVNIAIPILITINNIAMFIILLVNYKRYTQYIFYHLGLFLISLTPALFYLLNVSNSFGFMIIAILTTTISLTSAIIFSGKDSLHELKKRFHF